MLVVAHNVGPLFFSLVPSLNDDVCEPFALKNNNVSLKRNLIYLSFKSIEMLKMHLNMENIELMYVGSLTYRL